MTRESQAGPTAVPAQLGERFPSGLLVRGRYRVISEVGSGAFGTVCLGQDESTGHRVAIRFLPRNFASTPQAAQAVMRMGRSIVAASVSHPAMARVLEFGELDMGRPFTVTEFVEGQRLDQVAARPALEVHATLRLALELGGAIETLHNIGFVHGAIAPRNVIMLEDGHVKLLDLELAGLRDAREVQGLVNTEPPAEYLSPEQIQKAPITEKTDIYAFGVLLHELLSGAPPFQAATREAIFTKHLKQAPFPVHRLREGVPASVSRAITLALYKQPEARPLMGDILNLLWTGAHGPAPRRTRTAVIAGGAVLASCAIAAVIWGTLSLRTPESPTSQPSVGTVPLRPTVPAVETRRPRAPRVDAPMETGRPAVESLAPTVRGLAPSARTPDSSAVMPPVKNGPTVVAPPADRVPAAPSRPTTAPAPSATTPTPPTASLAPAAPAVTAPPPAPSLSVPPAPPVAAPPRPAPAPPAATSPAPSVTRSAPVVTAPPPAVSSPLPPVTTPPPVAVTPPRPTPAPSAATAPTPAVTPPPVATPQPAVAAPPRLTPAPSTQSASPPAARVERREPGQTQAQPAPAAQAPSRPDPDDSGAVIDWLLKPR